MKTLGLLQTSMQNTTAQSFNETAVQISTYATALGITSYSAPSVNDTMQYLIITTNLPNVNTSMEPPMSTVKQQSLNTVTQSTNNITSPLSVSTLMMQTMNAVTVHPKINNKSQSSERFTTQSPASTLMQKSMSLKFIVDMDETTNIQPYIPVNKTVQTTIYTTTQPLAITTKLPYGTSTNQDGAAFTLSVGMALDEFLLLACVLC